MDIYFLKNAYSSKTKAYREMCLDNCPADNYTLSK